VVAGSSPSSPTTQSRATRIFPVSAEHPGFFAVRSGRVGPFTVSVTKEARPEVVWGLSSLASGHPFPGARRRRLPETRFAKQLGVVRQPLARRPAPELCRDDPKHDPVRMVQFHDSYLKSRPRAGYRVGESSPNRSGKGRRMSWRERWSNGSSCTRRKVRIPVYRVPRFVVMLVEIGR
jgi:hypothetical protein